MLHVLCFTYFTYFTYFTLPMLNNLNDFTLHMRAACIMLCFTCHFSLSHVSCIIFFFESCFVYHFFFQLESCFVYHLACLACVAARAKQAK